jgi:hypothetical protein
VGHLELHAGALIQGTVSVRLNGGKVHEYILACFALDESEALGRVKPLHCTFLSHSKPLEKIADLKQELTHIRRNKEKGCRTTQPHLKFDMIRTSTKEAIS